MLKNKNAYDEYAVVMKDVSKIYRLKQKGKKQGNQQFYALKGIDFKIKKGDCVGILGTNGSGKSTLSMILAGISDHDGGEMIVNGEQVLLSLRS